MSLTGLIRLDGCLGMSWLGSEGREEGVRVRGRVFGGVGGLNRVWGSVRRRS